MHRVQMLHKHEAHAGVYRHMLEQEREGLQPSGGSSDAHNKKASRKILWPVCFLRVVGRGSSPDSRRPVSLLSREVRPVCDATP